MLYIGHQPRPHQPRPPRVRAAARAAIGMLCWLAVAGGVARAQGDGALKIGFLSQGTERGQMRPVIERLRDALLADPAVTDGMRERGYTDIWLRPCDEPFDMIQRLGAREFEIAFATSVIYARQFRPLPGEPEVFQAAAYEPVFQFRRLKGDLVDSRGNGVFRRGVIFAGPTSRLWGGTPSVEELSAELAREPIAVPDSYSATGYIYPRLRLADEWSTLTLRGPLFCRSEDAVIKHVVSGLANVGACDAALLDELPPSGYHQELLRTDPIPADPILLRADLMPESAGGGLGRELRVAIQKFFNAPEPPLPGVKVEKAGRRAFEDMARALRRFDALQQAGAAPEAAR